MKLPVLARRVVRRCLRVSRPFVRRSSSVLSLLPSGARPIVGSIIGTVGAALGGGALAWAQSAAETVAGTRAVTAQAANVEWWQAIILGIVQGLTEFIPVSSSGHLNITHALMGHPRELPYDVLLHVGTVAALIFYFRDDWKALIFDPSRRKLLWLILLSMIPAVFGALLTRKIFNWQEEAWLFTSPIAHAIFLAVGGAILLLADKRSRQSREMGDVGIADALWVGLGQAIALIPGVSRSGATLTAGLFLGLKRADAARFSFLMSLPVMLGAFVFEFAGVASGGAGFNADLPAMILGVLSSAIAGFWAIGFLLNYLKTRDVTPFFVWRLMVAIAVFAYFA